MTQYIEVTRADDGAKLLFNKAAIICVAPSNDDYKCLLYIECWPEPLLVQEEYQVLALRLEPTL